ncbi:10387_t:CDS:2 [Paraglomus brasilianum]|uniref:10387_t:CDS:1 n=1 Tax=Paraglomus brasilianum TaxID=144538 RepID=A0A9N9ADD5_9GLOM|nr:10387_t:CDS:2 [Paraglomus brasilianum]
MTDAESTNNPAFIEAANEVRSLGDSLTQEDLLKLYGLFKQATIGKVNTTAPSSIFDPKGAAKHRAWSDVGDKSKEEAQAAYVAFVEEIKARAGQ